MLALITTPMNLSDPIAMRYDSRQSDGRQLRILLPTIRAGVVVGAWALSAAAASAPDGRAEVQYNRGHPGGAMEKFEYFSGTPEVGIVPRAPHAGPLIRHLYEQEHGRGGFAMKSWAGYTTDPRFAWRATRLAEVQALAERVADARDELAPKEGQREQRP